MADTAATTLIGAELIFAQRMLPHFMAGLSVFDAAKAVLADDDRLFGAFCKQSSSHFVPTSDERGYSHRTANQTGDLIATEISREVYSRLRAA